MARTVADCRRWPNDSNCSLTIIGARDEVVRAAAEHAASVHGHQDTPELRELLRQFLEPAAAYSNQPRAKESDADLLGSYEAAARVRWVRTLERAN